MEKESLDYGLSSDKLARLWNIGSGADSDEPEDGLISGGTIPEIEGYEVINKLGEGGMGVVWRALQLSTHREVALKVLDARTFGSSKALSRFEREIELAARLKHPNIASVYDSGLHKGLYYYAMELIEGKPLDTFVEERHLGQRAIVELMQLVCKAVNHAHQMGIIHRDLKPSNILVADNGQPQIVDFGLAKAFLESDRDPTVSTEGDFFGTPAYMSPEQAGGHVGEIDTRSDVYSLGVIFFNVLTKQWPYDVSGSSYQVLRNIQEKGPIRPSKILPKCDADLEAILLKALAKKREERYQSAAEFSHDIQCWLEGLPVAAHSVNILYLLKKLIARHRAVSFVIGLLVVIIVNTSVISLYFYGQARSQLRAKEKLVEAYKATLKRDVTFKQQVAFDLFLERWQTDSIPAARATCTFFDPKSREGLAAQFLIDSSPLDLKKSDYQSELSAEQVSFWPFVLGECYLKAGNLAAATEAYRQCVNAEDTISELDDWYINKAKARLYELSGDDVQAPMRRTGMSE